MSDRSFFGVVILAAGASSRMGRPKMLLPWGETTVLGRLIEQWRGIGAGQIAVACASEDMLLAAELDRLGVLYANRIPNPDPSRGMFSSIQCAARWENWNPTLSHIAVALGDQPHLSIRTLRAVTEFASAHPRNICQPCYGGRARHPVFIPMHLFKSLAAIDGGTLKEFLRAHASDLRLIELDDPGLELDLDTPAEYARALQDFVEVK